MLAFVRGRPQWGHGTRRRPTVCLSISQREAKGLP